MLKKQFVIVAVVLTVICGLIVTGCTNNAKKPVGLKKARLLVELPDYCNTPDGMALMPDGGFVLSVPNYNDPNAGAFIMKVSAKNKVSKVFVPPPHPKTGLQIILDLIPANPLNVDRAACLNLIALALHNGFGPFIAGDFRDSLLTPDAPVIPLPP